MVINKENPNHNSDSGIIERFEGFGVSILLGGKATLYGTFALKAAYILCVSI